MTQLVRRKRGERWEDPFIPLLHFSSLFVTYRSVSLIFAAWFYGVYDQHSGATLRAGKGIHGAQALAQWRWRKAKTGAHAQL